MDILNGISLFKTHNIKIELLCNHFFQFNFLERKNTFIKQDDEMFVTKNYLNLIVIQNYVCLDMEHSTNKETT